MSVGKRLHNNTPARNLDIGDAMLGIRPQPPRPTFAAGMYRHVARVIPACRRRPRQSGVTEALLFFGGP